MNTIDLSCFFFYSCSKIFVAGNATYKPLCRLVCHTFFRVCEWPLLPLPNRPQQGCRVYGPVFLLSFPLSLFLFVFPFVVPFGFLFSSLILFFVSVFLPVFFLSLFYSVFSYCLSFCLPFYLSFRLSFILKNGSNGSRF